MICDVILNLAVIYFYVSREYLETGLFQEEKTSEKYFYPKNIAV